MEKNYSKLIFNLLKFKIELKQKRDNDIKINMSLFLNLILGLNLKTQYLHTLTEIRTVLLRFHVVCADVRTRSGQPNEVSRNDES
jgi:hypothetical protein